jgi:hypothetical protein
MTGKLAGRSFVSDPLEFYYHHDARGWMLGRNKMKNWHSAAATWELNERKWAKERGGSDYSDVTVVESER